MIIFVLNNKGKDNIINFFDIWVIQTFHTIFLKILNKLKIIIFYIELRFFN